jgi:hypothetical protein
MTTRISKRFEHISQPTTRLALQLCRSITLSRALDLPFARAHARQPDPPPSPSRAARPSSTSTLRPSEARRRHREHTIHQLAVLPPTCSAPPASSCAAWRACDGGAEPPTPVVELVPPFFRAPPLRPAGAVFHGNPRGRRQQRTLEGWTQYLTPRHRRLPTCVHRRTDRTLTGSRVKAAVHTTTRFSREGRPSLQPSPPRQAIVPTSARRG